MNSIEKLSELVGKTIVAVASTDQPWDAMQREKWGDCNPDTLFFFFEGGSYLGIAGNREWLTDVSPDRLSHAEQIRVGLVDPWAQARDLLANMQDPAVKAALFEQLQAERRGFQPLTSGSE